jgi:hypothetical protein
MHAYGSGHIGWRARSFLANTATLSEAFAKSVGFSRHCKQFSKVSFSLLGNARNALLLIMDTII